MPASGAHWCTFHTQSHLKVRPLWNSCFRLALTLILTYHTLVYFLCASSSSVTFNCHHWFLFGVFPRCFLLRLISPPPTCFFLQGKLEYKWLKYLDLFFSPHTGMPSHLLGNTISRSFAYLPRSLMEVLGLKEVRKKEKEIAEHLFMWEKNRERHMVTLLAYTHWNCSFMISAVM